MQFKTYYFLPQEAVYIRTAVFIQEQGFQNEFDEIDNEAVHIVAYSDENEPIAVCRVYEAEDTFIFGRLAVIKEFRGRNIGSLMITEAEKIVSAKGGNSIMLHAQCRVKDFYNKFGYSAVGTEDEDEGCPHIWMKKDMRVDK